MAMNMPEFLTLLEHSSHNTFTLREKRMSCEKKMLEAKLAYFEAKSSYQEAMIDELEQKLTKKNLSAEEQET